VAFPKAQLDDLRHCASLKPQFLRLDPL
jgi:hypothetical protein